MTDEVEAVEAVETVPVPAVHIFSRTLHIVVLAMAVVMVCISIVSVLVVFNERSTQKNADSQARINEELQVELECLRTPAFESDQALATLSIITARGLAAVSQDDQDVLESLATELQIGADDLEAKLAARKESLETCKQTD